MAQKEMYRAVTNSPFTTLAVAINSMDSTIPVVDTSVFATAPGIATIFDDNYTETIKYTGIDTTNKTLTGVTRGFDGSARDWAQGKAIARLLTAYDVNIFIDNIKDCFQFANDGKTSVANIIGSPTVATETFTQIAGDVQTQKNNLATSLTSKGVSASGTETLKALVDKVANTSAVKFAAGTYSTAIVAGAQATISGLNFTPNKILLCYPVSSIIYISASAYLYIPAVGYSSWVGKSGDSPPLYIPDQPSSTSFTIKNESASSINSIRWEAYYI